MCRCRLGSSNVTPSTPGAPSFCLAGGAPDWATQAGSVLRLQARICIPFEICIAQEVIEASDDRRRHEHAEPRLDDQSFDAGLLKGRYLRQARRAPSFAPQAAP
jgi:hypothetical protein